MDLTLFKDEITFGVNAIYLNFHKMDFKPTYYVIEDMAVAEDRKDEINKLTGMTKIIPLYLAYSLKKTRGTIYLNHEVSMINFPEFSRDASIVTYPGSTVTYLNLQLAYHMGCNPVYLIGVDFSYKIPKSAIVKGVDILSTEDDPNHFHPNYFGKGYRWHTPKLDVVMKAYQYAKKVYKENGRKIINATVGGKLDVFERVNYSDLF